MYASDYQDFGISKAVNLLGRKLDIKKQESFTLEFNFMEQNSKYSVISSSLQYMPSRSLLKPYYTSIKDEPPKVTITEMKKEGDVLLVKGSIEGVMYRVKSARKKNQPKLKYIQIFHPKLPIQPRSFFLIRT